MPLPIQRVLQALGSASFGDRYSAEDVARDFYATFLDDPRGARVLMKLADLSGWQEAQPPMDLNGNETPLMMSFREGRRSMFRDIINLLAEDPAPPEVITGEG